MGNNDDRLAPVLFRVVNTVVCSWNDYWVLSAISCRSGSGWNCCDRLNHWPFVATIPNKEGRVMTDMLQKGQEWLASKLTQHASRQVVYRRGELGATLQATIGKSMYDQDDGEGIVTRSQVRDFLIDTYALLSSIIGTLPRRGDTIVEIDGEHTFIFEVMALGGDPPWRYSDPFRLKLRIHTKQIESHPS
jgi:hypothetical protein